MVGISLGSKPPGHTYHHSGASSSFFTNRFVPTGSPTGSRTNSGADSRFFSVSLHLPNPIQPVREHQPGRFLFSRKAWPSLHHGRSTLPTSYTTKAQDASPRLARRKCQRTILEKSRVQGHHPRKCPARSKPCTLNPCRAAFPTTGATGRFRRMPAAHALNNVCSTNRSCNSWSPEDNIARSGSTKGRCRCCKHRCTHNSTGTCRSTHPTLRPRRRHPWLAGALWGEAENEEIERPR